MDQNLAFALMFITVIIALTVMLIALLNFQIKRRMIKSGIVDAEAVKALSKLQYDFKVDTLKWGLLLLSGGIGLVLISLLPLNANSPLPYGIELICLAAGFLAYYLISRKN